MRKVVVSWGPAESVIRKMYSCVITSFPQCIISFLLVRKDKGGSAEPAGLHMLFHASPAVDQRKRGGSLVHQPDELVPVYKISIFFSAQASRTRSVVPLTVPRKSWSRGYVVSTYLLLLLSNWLSPKALKQGPSWGGHRMTVFFAVMPCCKLHLRTLLLSVLLVFVLYLQAGYSRG